MIVNLRPSGQYHMEDLYEAGGIPMVLQELRPLLHLDTLTITGKTLGAILDEICPRGSFRKPDVVRSLANPVAPEGGIATLFGNLCPNGAVIKQSAASSHLLKHRGRALVFKNQEDLEARIDQPDLEVSPDDILVLQNVGPVGAPGMPEWGSIAMPKRLLDQGVRDMVRISDARMSGTAAGTVVLHVSPESAIGGPLAFVRTGDWIELDVAQRRLQMLVDDTEMLRRRSEWVPPPPAYTRGYGKLFVEHVMQAHEGCDFDFC